MKPTGTGVRDSSGNHEARPGVASARSLTWLWDTPEDGDNQNHRDQKHFA